MLHVTAFKSPVRSVGVRACCLTCTQSHRWYRHNERCAHIYIYTHMRICDIRTYTRTVYGAIDHHERVPMSTRSTPPLPRRSFLSGIHRDWINVNFVSGRARKLPRPLRFIVAIHADNDGDDHEDDDDDDDGTLSLTRSRNAANYRGFHSLCLARGAVAQISHLHRRISRCQIILSSSTGPPRSPSRGKWFVSEIFAREQVYRLGSVCVAY